LLGIEATPVRRALTKREVQLYAGRPQNDREKFLVSALFECESYLEEKRTAGERLAWVEAASRFRSRVQREFMPLRRAMEECREWSARLDDLAKQPDWPRRARHDHDLLCETPVRIVVYVERVLRDLERIKTGLVAPFFPKALSDPWVLRKSVAKKLRAAGLSIAEVARVLDPEGYAREREAAAERMRRLLARSRDTR
jgi:hypothetical protein